MWQDKASMYNMDIDDFLFSFGGGLRLTIPGLPIGFYLTKRFKTEGGVVEWQTGELFNRDNEPGKGLDLAISFTYELF
jgi:outer membrane protein insertion porin family